MKRAPAGAKVAAGGVLNARQFCLKLIANVTYGYAAAGFSGRMPMAELADAIVQVNFSKTIMGHAGHGHVPARAVLLCCRVWAMHSRGLHVGDC